MIDSPTKHEIGQGQFWRSLLLGLGLATLEQGGSSHPYLLAMLLYISLTISPS
jgi:hypothetical protein